MDRFVQKGGSHQAFCTAITIIRHQVRTMGKFSIGVMVDSFRIPIYDAVVKARDVFAAELPQPRRMDGTLFDGV